MREGKQIVNRFEKSMFRSHNQSLSLRTMFVEDRQNRRERHDSRFGGTVFPVRGGNAHLSKIRRLHGHGQSSILGRWNRLRMLFLA
jgi:hypothetical protein